MIPTRQSVFARIPDKQFLYEQDTAATNQHDNHFQHNPASNPRHGAKQYDPSLAAGTAVRSRRGAAVCLSDGDRGEIPIGSKFMNLNGKQ